MTGGAGRDRLVWTPAPVRPPGPRTRVRAVLGGLDLDAVPASVTPPRTWRHAAAFAVGCAAAVLAGLSGVVLLVAAPAVDGLVEAGLGQTVGHDVLAPLTGDPPSGAPSGSPGSSSG